MPSTSNPHTIGNQLMALKPAKRRCPKCLGPITLIRGCGNRGVPTCDKCGFFPRGKMGITDLRLTFDNTGTVSGWARPSESTTEGSTHAEHP